MENLYERAAEEEYTKSYIKYMYGFYGYGLWIVIEKKSGLVIGRAGIEHREVDEAVELELGYVIGKEYQRKGYATEACTAIIKYASELLEFPYINCFLEEENLPSVRLAKKLGFTFCSKKELDGKLYSHYRKGLL